MRSVPRPAIALAIGALVAITVLPLTACSNAPQTGSDAAAPAKIVPRGQVVFDMGHGEIFGAQDTSELGQSQAIARMQNSGFQVAINTDSITTEDLRRASGLILAGPMAPLTDEEYVVIKAFVERGGTVLLTIHVPFPVLKVPAHWGLPVGTEIMMSKTPVDPNQPSVFVADQVSEGALMRGVKQVLVVSGWPVSAATEQAELVVNTRPDTWLSAAGDQQPTPPADATFASYGVIGVTSIGKGRVIVSGDDAIFANLALSQVDNAKLLDNIIGMMSEVESL